MMARSKFVRNQVHLGAARGVCSLVMAMLLLPGARPQSDPSPPAETRSRPDYTSFRLITERNIFDASRSGRRPDPPRETRRPTRVDTFALVGTLSYDRGTFAFFDGSSAEYRKALEVGGALGDFQLLEILPSAVRILGGTNATEPTELALGMQMRREEAGEWQLTERSESFTSAGPGPRSSGSGASSRSSPTPAAASSAADEEVLKRLMEKREREAR